MNSHRHRPAVRGIRAVCGLALALVSIAGAWGCAASPEAPRPEPPRPPLVEEDLKPEGRAEVAILDLDEEVDADQAQVTVRGTLLNRGSRATRRIIVHVQALDEAGAVLAETQAYANPEAIDPGNSGTFQVRLDNVPGIQDYHVEVLYKP